MKQDIHFTEQLEKRTQTGNEIWPVSKNSTKKVAWKLIPGPFVFIKIYTQPLLENGIFKTS